MLGVILSLIGVSYVITKGNYRNIFDSNFIWRFIHSTCCYILGIVFNISKKNETGVSGFSFIFIICIYSNLTLTCLFI